MIPQQPAPTIHPITEAMIIRVELHAILEKYGISDPYLKAQCGLEILQWMSDRLIVDQRIDGR